MREIDCRLISETVARLCVEAACRLPGDVKSALEDAKKREESPVGLGILDDLCENFRIAEEKNLPICQDTGMAVIFIEMGQEVHISGGSLREAVDEGVRRGYAEGRLRCSVVPDPLRRVNSGDNTPAALHIELREGDGFKITAAPKGFGSENMSVMKMFNPSATVEDIEDFIVSAVDSAGSRPCPPVILGVGLGGTVELAALCAKRALLRPLDEENPDELYARMERETLEKINRLGIGPQGLGGRVTALKVSIETAATHIAGLPCVVNFSCHATRHASAEI